MTAPKRIFYAKCHDGIWRPAWPPEDWPEGKWYVPEDIFERVVEALRAICANAEVIPDSRMEGATDVIAVPLDDIDAANAILSEGQSE